MHFTHFACYFGSDRAKRFPQYFPETHSECEIKMSWGVMQLTTE